MHSVSDLSNKSYPSAFRFHASPPVKIIRVVAVTSRFNNFGTERTNPKPQAGPKLANRNPRSETRNPAGNYLGALLIDGVTVEAVTGKP